MDAATKAFAAKGYGGVSTSEIAECANVAQSVVHYHFRDKETLWRAAVDHLFDKVNKAELTLLQLDQQATPLEQLKTLVRRFVFIAAKYPELGRLVMHEGPGGGPRLNWLVQKHFRHSYESFDKLIKEAQAEGKIKPYPVGYLTLIVTAAAASLFNMAPIIKQVWNQDVSRGSDLNSVADMVVDLIFDGISNFENENHHHPTTTN